MKPKDQHETFEYQASRYLDGTLSDDERTGFESELSRQPELHRIVNDYRSVDDAVMQWADVEPKIDWDHFEASVRAGRIRIDARRRQTRSGLRWFVPLAAAASIALTFFMLRSTSLESSPKTFVRITPPIEIQKARQEVVVTFAADQEYSEEFANESLERESVIVVAAVGSHVRLPGIDGSPNVY